MGGIAHGLASISSAIGGIITLIILILIPILAVFGLAVTAVLGFIGGKIGGATRTFTAPRGESTHTQSQPSLRPTPPPSTNCPACGRITSTAEARYCPHCGAPYAQAVT